MPEKATCMCNQYGYVANIGILLKLFDGIAIIIRCTFRLSSSEKT
jgi:hypothetical protein